MSRKIMKSTSAILLFLLFFLVFVPLARASAEENPATAIPQMDQEIYGLLNTLTFFQELALQKGDKKLAKKIEKQSAAFSQKNLKLHQTPIDSNKQIRQEKINKSLQKQAAHIYSLQKQLEEQVDKYWEQLIPELSLKQKPQEQELQPQLASRTATAFAAAAPVLDPFEPNDDVDTSYPVTSGNFYNSKLSTAKDLDMYRFDSGAQSGELTVTLRVPEDKNFDLAVMQAPNKVVGMSTRGGVGVTENVTFQVQPNTTYYFSVFSMSRDFSETTSYLLSFSKITTVLNLAQPVDISLPTGETPGYRFTAPVTGTYRFYTSPYGGFGAPFDTVLSVFRDEQLQQALKFNDEAVDGSLFSEIKVSLDAGVTYFVLATSFDSTKGLHARLTAALDASASVVSAALHESSANDGTLTETQTVVLKNGTFTSDAASFVTVHNVATGLQPLVTRVNSTQLSIQFTGKAVEHEQKHRATNLFVTIPKAKIAGADADVTTDTFALEFTNTDSFTLAAPPDLDLAKGSKKIYKFTAPSSGDFELSTTYFGGVEGSGPSNTKLAIYEDFGETRLLAANDDGDHPPFSKAIVSMEKGRDYYVVVSSADNNAVHARLLARYTGVEYVYNAKGQLTQIRQNGQVLSEFTYDSNGNLSKKTDY